MGFAFSSLLFRIPYTRNNRATSKGSDNARNRKRRPRKTSKKIYYFTKKLRNQVVKQKLKH